MHEGRAEAGTARRRRIERHPVGGERLQAAPQPFKLGCVDAGVDAAGINQLSVRTVIGEKQSAEIRAASFRIGPADHEGKPNPSNSAASTTPVRCQADSTMD
jgi:hypothetical protein